MDATDGRMVLVTAPDAATARDMVRTLVEERLIACGNIVPAITSIYRWQGKVKEAGEALLILKTTRARLDAVRARVVELHPYDVPEVLAFGMDGGHQAYLDWLGDCVAPGRRDGTEA